jgi:hypothetical protein
VRFLEALADAIRVYSLTVDVLDSLIDPIALFHGFEKANPGKLGYFFARRVQAYPILFHFFQRWGAGVKPPWGDFHHPRGAMLYTTCHHYRTAVFTAALATLGNADVLPVLEYLLRNLAYRVRYIQSGNAMGFRNDTRRIVEETLVLEKRVDLVEKLGEVLSLEKRDARSGS